MSTSTSPDVFRYLDHRKFLSDWFAWKKSSNSRFSHRMFARLAQQRSPSLLMHVIRNERNLTATTSAAFCKAMGLDREERAFFTMLVEFDRADNNAERNLIWERLSASRRFVAARSIDGGAFRYLSRWYYPAIRELAACENFQGDPAWIAAVLRPKITASQAAEALSVMLELGLLSRDDAGTIQLTEATVATPHQVQGLAVHNYHQGMIGRAEESIERFSKTERHLSAITVAIPAELVPSLKAEIDAFQERILDLCDSAEGSATRVYQFNMQLFPLSAEV
ncbi:MAG: hypothetical protein ACI8RZ_004531 [Myxococcota bacterium]|jgi:uncharacterized protein (TIGR02147 family)